MKFWIFRLPFFVGFCGLLCSYIAVASAQGGKQNPTPKPMPRELSDRTKALIRAWKSLETWMIRLSARRFSLAAF